MSTVTATSGLAGIGSTGMTPASSNCSTFELALTHALALPEIKARMAELEIHDLKIVPPTASLSPGTYGNTLTFQFKWKKYKNYLTATLPWGYFPGCCGIQVVHNISMPTYAEYPKPGEDYNSEKYCTKKGFGTFFVELITRLYEIRASVRSAPGIILAATTDLQTGGTRIMEKLKWKRLGTVVNPNTMREITLWMKKVSPFSTARDRAVAAKLATRKLTKPAERTTKSK